MNNTTCVKILAAFFLLYSFQGQAADWPNWRGANLDGISTETDWNTDWTKKDPQVLWKDKVGIGYSSMAVADGKVVTLGNKSKKDTIYCFDAVTGEIAWTHEYDAPIIAKFYKGGPGGTPTIDNGKVYSLSKVGHLWCLDLKSGDVLWSKNLVKDHGAKKRHLGLRLLALDPG